MSAQGLGFGERYLFRIGLRPSNEDASAFPFVFAETMGFELVDGTNLDAVLGMDVLSQCDFEMLRSGTCRLRFG
jgi:hypothetical protein